MGCILEKMDDNNAGVPKDKSNISNDKSKENSTKVSYENNLRIKIPKERKYKKNNYN